MLQIILDCQELTLSLSVYLVESVEFLVVSNIANSTNNEDFKASVSKNSTTVNSPFFPAET